MTPDDTYKKLKTPPLHVAFAEQIANRLGPGDFILYFLVRKPDGKASHILKLPYSQIEQINEDGYEFDSMSGAIPSYRIKE